MMDSHTLYLAGATTLVVGVAVGAIYAADRVNLKQLTASLTGQQASEKQMHERGGKGAKKAAKAAAKAARAQVEMAKSREEHKEPAAKPAVAKSAPAPTKPVEKAAEKKVEGKSKKVATAGGTVKAVPPREAAPEPSSSNPKKKKKKAAEGANGTSEGGHHAPATHQDEEEGWHTVGKSGKAPAAAQAPPPHSRPTFQPVVYLDSAPTPAELPVELSGHQLDAPADVPAASKGGSKKDKKEKEDKKVKAPDVRPGKKTNPIGSDRPAPPAPAAAPSSYTAAPDLTLSSTTAAPRRSEPLPTQDEWTVVPKKSRKPAGVKST